MIIDSYAVNASSQRSYQKLEYEQTSVELNTGGIMASANGGDVVSISDAARQALSQARGNPNNLQGALATGSITSSFGTPQSAEDLKLKMLESFLFALTGKRVSLQMDFGESLAGQGRIRQTPFAGGLGGSIQHTSLRYERESTTYQAQGVVKTADGKTINLDVSLSMSREFMELTHTRLDFGPPRNLVDPLVINYGGTAASLTGEKFAFDLDADGVLDQISFAGAGSGFLALDKNGDGKINNGSELFGPGTGNGFEELRSYDKDGNGWIDEADEIFSQLKIWSKDANGNDQLFTLQELGIGAIYLGDVSTQFSLTDAGNNTQGVMRSTSFFLRENGTAGTVSHIDLSV